MQFRLRAVAAVAAIGFAATSAVLIAPGAQAASGNKSLASVLLMDTTAKGKPSFDKNGGDFDILTAAVLAVLADNPSSSVGVLTDGSVKLTAFLPTDRAFERTGAKLGLTAKSEARLVGKYVAALGIGGIESVLLYHVVPGVKINAKAAAKADGAVLDTALGQTIKVNVTKKGIFLKDKATSIRDPKVVVTDINKGNTQIAHAINRVLVPKLAS
jgi:uncharacterized surface protein with fasciclin (FAS1) repeats